MGRLRARSGRNTHSRLRKPAAVQDWTGDAVESACGSHDRRRDRNRRADPPVILDLGRQAQRIDLPAMLLQAREPEGLELQRQLAHALFERELETAREQMPDDRRSVAAVATPIP